MAFLAIRNALLARITGVDATAVGVLLRQRGLTAAARERDASKTAKDGAIGVLKFPTAPVQLLRNVPVIPYDIAGRNYSEMPVVSVYLARPPVPRRDASYVHDDAIVEDVESSMKRVTFSDGTTVEGAALIRERPSPRPYTYEFTIRVWATNEGDAYFIYERLLDLLDERGYLRVTLKDGTTTSYDTAVGDSPTPVEVPEGLINEGDEGEYSLILSYTVEGYFDTTDQKTLIRTIQGRTLESGAFDEEDASDSYQPDTVELLE